VNAARLNADAEIPRRESAAADLNANAQTASARLSAVAKRTGKSEYHQDEK
jgi:hypothetical protein